MGPERDFPRRRDLGRDQADSNPARDTSGVDSRNIGFGGQVVGRGSSLIGLLKAITNIYPNSSAAERRDRLCVDRAAANQHWIA